MPSSIPSIAVIANGQIENDQIIFEKLKKFDFVIAADGGAIHCLRMGIIPSLLMGDFDSVDDKTLAAFSSVPKMTFLKDKDETDLELAIGKAFSLNPEKVSLFAATGNRVDHTLVNLHILRRFPAKLFIETENETIFSLNQEITIDTRLGQTLSLLPIGKSAKDVTTKGLKWELNNSTLDENFLSISNICLAETVTISLKDGDLLCFLQR